MANINSRLLIARKAPGCVTAARPGRVTLTSDGLVPGRTDRCR
jgi:hypothetical protein